MNTENQNIEFKESWRDEYLKWICGFANAHRSLPHNPDIANTFFRAGFIESWGRGIEKICTLCKNYGIPEPEYTVHPGDIMLKFNSNTAVNTDLDDGMNIGMVDESGQNNLTDKEGDLPEGFPKTSQRLPKDFPKASQRTYEAVCRNPNATLAELSAELGVSERTIKSHFALLKKARLIKRVGGKTYGHWEIINE